MVKVLASTLVIFVVAWLIFAIWNIGGGNDVIKVYSATTTINRKRPFQEGGNLPLLLPMKVSEYRVSETHVVEKLGSLVTKYEDCTIIDKGNWSCKKSDDSARFGLRSYRYFSFINTKKFPYLKDFRERTYLSRFEYVILRCHWDLSNGFIQMFACSIRPFST